MRLRTALVVVCIICLTLAAGLLAFSPRPTVVAEPEIADLIRQAEQALRQRRYRVAEQAARRALSADRASSRALIIAGEAATRLERFDDALAYYRRVNQDGSGDAVTALWASGEILWKQGRLAESERLFRSVLEIEPDHFVAHDRLSTILGLTGRRWESVPHLFQLVRQRNFTLQQLVYLGAVENAIDAAVDLQRLAHPDDPIAPLGLARIHLLYNRVGKARELLQEVIEIRPNELEAHARLGEILVENASEAELLHWHERLPSHADQHPEIWIVRGFWSKRRGDYRAAARCFWEAVARDPNHQVANYQLGQVLSALGEYDLARPFETRHRRLDELARTLEGINGVDAATHRLMTEGKISHDLIPTMRAVAGLLEELGRPWEARAWYQAVLNIAPNLGWARREWDRLSTESARSDPPRTLPDANPARQVNLTAYPLPDWAVPSSAGPVAAPRSGSAEPRIRFRDLAVQAGIDFTFISGTPSDAEGKRIFQTTGGGVGIVDYDADGWPDVYLTQGGVWPPDPSSAGPSDRLYRNLASGTFQDVTAQTGARDCGYGQGVSTGDYNNDGFSDLYVANIGRNSLYRNNGDGTFADLTEESGIVDERWTTSCLIADLDGDGSPDLYDVNYLRGEKVFDQRCPSLSGMRVCSPSAFDAEQDQIHANLGNGRFQNVTGESGIIVPDGKGLGIVAADFEGTGLLNLFVANDQVANFYFVNQSTPAGPAPRFSEAAVPLGLAYDREGKTQACMGIAVADADQNGRLDLFVTNFFDESNTLYVHQPGGYFIDGTQPAGLRDPGYSMLGFGTQFLDADLNGLADLVVTNGHVDDYRKVFNIPYRMPPQLYRNLGGGAFEELPREGLGDFFQKEYLGRGLARTDWNRDGREDFVVSHLDAPASLATNDTSAAGRSLAVSLRGVESSRDAIGTTVEVEAGGQSRTQQLTGGDGYQASNQRQLVFGLGEARAVVKLRVRWPSGRTQAFADLPPNVELLLIEGRSEPVFLPQPRSKLISPGS